MSAHTYDTIVWFLLSYGFAALIWTKIIRRVGYPWYYGLSMLVPIVNLVVLLWLAFADWPIESRLLNLRLKHGIPEEEDADD